MHAVARGLALLIIVGSWMGWELLDRMAPAPAAAQAFMPATTREQWAMDFLAALGNAQPAPATVAMVVEWTLAEDGGSGAFDRNNPLNTTMCGFNMIGSINADGACGVGHYAAYQDGIAANVATINQSNFAEIRTALQANDPEAAKRALWASPWAASHYGYGSVWPVYQGQDAAPASLGCPVDPCWQSGTGYSTGHPGIDLGATLGQPVYAVLDGVAQTSQTWPCGNGVLITAGALQQIVCHLSAFSVADGQQVQAGAQIGDAGSSGLSTGPHVHFELRMNGASIDPMGGL